MDMTTRLAGWLGPKPNPVRAPSGGGAQQLGGAVQVGHREWAAAAQRDAERHDGGHGRHEPRQSRRSRRAAAANRSDSRGRPG